MINGSNINDDVFKNNMSNIIYAVVVSYRFCEATLTRQFELLKNQVDKIVWVDNADDERVGNICKIYDKNRLTCISLKKNFGIAVAQNIGIEHAELNGASHVLLMDQDSRPEEGMVDELLNALSRLPDAGAVGPCYFDERRLKKISPFYSVKGRFKLIRQDCKKGGVVEVDHLIASGSLIPLEVLKEVGGMREEFFIDWVDVEWSLRAKKRGYKMYGVCAATMFHTLGDSLYVIFGKEIPLHSPWRHYYQARNLILTFWSGDVDISSRFLHVTRQAKRFLLFSTFVPNRLSYFKMWILGVVHGLKIISGRAVHYSPINHD